MGKACNRKIFFLWLALAAAMPACSFQDATNAGQDVPTETVQDAPPQDTMPDWPSLDTMDDGIGVDLPEGLCPQPCSTDEECGVDEVFCNGEEYCSFDDPDPLTGQGCCDVIPACPEPSNPCVEFSCMEAVRQCVENPVDADDDGYVARTVQAPDGTMHDCGGGDCDDGAYAVHPGAPELCDNVDNDCDDVADEDAWSAAGEPLRLNQDPAYVTDADLAVLGDGWLVVRTERDAGVMAANVASGALEAASHGVAGTAGAVEVELVVRPSGGIFLFWTTGTEVHAAGLSNEEGFPVESSVMLHGETEAGSAATDLEAVLSPGGASAAVFFRSQQHGNSEIYMSALDLDNPSTPPSPALRVSQAIGFSGYPAAAPGPDRIAVAWEDERDGNKEIYAKTLDPSSGDASRAYRITAAPGDSSMPALAAASEGFWVVWMDESGGPFSIMAARLDAQGAPESYPIASTAESGAGLYPCASSDPRGAGNENQILILQVASSADQESLVLTGVGDGAAAIGDGKTLHSSSKTILRPALSEGSGSRALVWIEWEYARSDLFFLEIACL